MTRQTPSDSIQGTLNELLLQLHQSSSSRPSRADLLEVVWRGAAGEYVARHARPLGLANGALRIGVTVRSLQAELERMEADLLERLNSSGRIRVTAIRIEVLKGPGRAGASMPSAAQRRSAADGPVYEITVPDGGLAGARGQGELERGTKMDAAPELAVDADLPAVRDELKPVIHRLLTRHRARQGGTTSQGPGPASKG